MMIPERIRVKKSGVERKSDSSVSTASIAAAVITFSNREARKIQLKPDFDARGDSAMILSGYRLVLYKVENNI